MWLFGMILGLAGSAVSGQPGITETVFNRRFIPSIKPLMTYEQIVKLAGVAGNKTGEDKNAKPPMIQYKWQGGRGSVLTVRFGNNRMIEATILAPNNHTYLIRANGEIADITKKSVP